MTDTVWSVNILIGIGLIGVIWAIYKILTLDKDEKSSNIIPNNTKTSNK
jgi:hypothetical protein